LKIIYIVRGIIPAHQIANPSDIREVIGERGKRVKNNNKGKVQEQPKQGSTARSIGRTEKPTRRIDQASSVGHRKALVCIQGTSGRDVIAIFWKQDKLEQSHPRSKFLAPLKVP